MTTPGRWVGRPVPVDVYEAALRRSQLPRYIAVTVSPSGIGRFPPVDDGFYADMSLCRRYVHAANPAFLLGCVDDWYDAAEVIRLGAEYGVDRETTFDNATRQT